MLLAPPGGSRGSVQPRELVSQQEVAVCEVEKINTNNIAARRSKQPMIGRPPSPPPLAIISDLPTPAAADRLQRGDKRSAPWALFSSATDVAANRRRLPLDTSPATLALAVGGD